MINLKTKGELENICQNIIKIDSMIRSAMIINTMGHLVAGGMKKGLQSLENEKNDEMLFMELSLRIKMRHEFDKELGAVNFSMSHREKVIVMSFPLPDDNVLLVSTEKNIDFGTRPFDILKQIEPIKKKML